MIASRRFCRPWWKVQWCLVMVSNAKQPEIQTRLHLNARNTDDRQREDYPGKEITENIQELPWTNSWVGASICCGIASKSFIDKTVRTFCYCSSKINTRMLPQILGSRWCIGTSSTCSKDYKSCERLKLPSIWFLRKKKNVIILFLWSMSTQFYTVWNNRRRLQESQQSTNAFQDGSLISVICFVA